MTVTEELRARLRRMIDEQIPEGQTDRDTRFTDEELDDLIQEAASLNEAAAQAWRLKAARAFSERGGIESTTAGDETTRWASLKDYRDHCLQMAALYSADASSGSRLFSIRNPEVAGIKGSGDC